jgi:outer membrane biosynthesis protein TonB
MTQRRAMFALFLSSVVVCSIGLLAQGKDEKKKDDAQKKEIQSVVKFVDDAAAGQPASNDLDLKWVREDVLKAQGNKEYVPFTISIDPSKVAGDRVAFYWRVVSKNPAAPPAEPAPPAGKNDKKDKDKKDDKKDDKDKDKQDKQDKKKDDKDKNQAKSDQDKKNEQEKQQQQQEKEKGADSQPERIQRMLQNLEANPKDLERERARLRAVRRAAPARDW